MVTPPHYNKLFYRSQWLPEQQNFLSISPSYGELRDPTYYLIRVDEKSHGLQPYKNYQEIVNSLWFYLIIFSSDKRD